MHICVRVCILCMVLSGAVRCIYVVCSFAHINHRCRVCDLVACCMYVLVVAMAVWVSFLLFEYSLLFLTACAACHG